MKLKSFDFECEDCGHTEIRVLDLDEDDKDGQLCPKCDKIMLRLFGAPMVLKRTWPDGHRERHDASWKKFSDTTDLEILASNSDSDTAVDINQEIKKINKEKK